MGIACCQWLFSLCPNVIYCILASAILGIGFQKVPPYELLHSVLPRSGAVAQRLFHRE